MTIERYEHDRSNWSAQDHFDHKQTGNLPEREEYTEARKQALIDADLETEDDAVQVPVTDMTPEGHFRRLRERNRV